MGYIKKLNEFIKNMLDGKDKKRMVENTVIVIIIGIIIIIAGSTLFGGNKTKTEEAAVKQEASSEPVARNVSADDKAELEKEMEALLTQINGAGRVNIMITYVSGKEIVPAYDTKKTENNTNEKDSGGGTRSINQSDSQSQVVFEESQGNAKHPIVLKELLPQVKGVIVVADGATDPVVKENLTRAVQVLLDVPIHKIQVFERKR